MTATAPAPLDATAAARIARSFLPAPRALRRWNYHYVRAKLRSDPLYPGVVDALRGARAPLLDLGCGLGLLAHVLRGQGIDLPYAGIDNDAAKIVHARAAAARAGLDDVRFDALDLATATPAHHGSVALLDVLQFMAPEAQDRLLGLAIAMLAPGGRLVIRTGLEDGGPRARVTRGVDDLSRWLGWMNAAPRRYPRADALRQRLEAAGLRTEITALFGNTPFNNWRVVASHDG